MPFISGISKPLPGGFSRSAVLADPTRERSMIKHEREDDQSKYEENGHDPRRPVPPEDPGGKHQRPAAEDED